MTIPWEPQLLLKLEQAQAAPFYIIRPSGLDPTPRQSLLRWHSQFLNTYFVKVLKINSSQAQSKIELGHQDLLTIIQEEPLEYYKIETGDLKDFFQTQNYKPIELPQKLITIADAEYIPERYGNKMLKNLEEPQKNTTVFFLTSSLKPLLATIESRAIHLQLTLEKPFQFNQNDLTKPKEITSWFRQKWQEHSDLWNKYESLLEAFFSDPKHKYEILNAVKKDQKFQILFFNLILEWHQKNQSHYLAKNDILNEIQWFQQAKTFHNSPSERFFGLLYQTFQQK